MWNPLSSCVIRYNIHPLAGTIAYNVPRDWRASYVFLRIINLLLSHPLMCFTHQLLVLSALLQSSTLSDETSMTRSYHFKRRGHFPVPPRHSLLFFSSSCSPWAALLQSFSLSDELLHNIPGSGLEEEVEGGSC